MFVLVDISRPNEQLQNALSLCSQDGEEGRVDQRDSDGDRVGDACDPEPTRSMRRPCSGARPAIMGDELAIYAANINIRFLYLIQIRSEPCLALDAVQRPV